MPDSLKWGDYHISGTLPFDLADMDFSTAPEITQAVVSRASQGQFGYSTAPLALTNSVVQRMAQLYQWHIRPEWIVWLPGTVSGLRVATMAFCQPSESVVTFTPVYTPFLQIPQSYDRSLVTVPLEEQTWRIDFPAFERSLTQHTKLLLLCNPHNPTGVMWTKDEIDQLVRICTEHGVTICSDEVHAELILDPSKKHIPTACTSPLAADHTVTLMSASKTFNLAGMSCGFAIVPNDDLRTQFVKVRHATTPAVSTLGYAATLAAFTHADGWKEELLECLRQNKRLIKNFCAAHNLRMTNSDASYLAWIEMRQRVPSDISAEFKRHGLAICDGSAFGCPGYIRFNFACSREKLEKGLSLFESVLECEDQKCKA